VSGTGGGRVYRCLGSDHGANAPIPHCQFAVVVHIADHAALTQVNNALVSLADPQQWPALLDAWRRQNTNSVDARDCRLAELDRDLTNANDRLARAADVLLDPTRTDSKANYQVYEALRDRELRSIDAIKADRDRLGGLDMLKSRQVQKLPSLERVFAAGRRVDRNPGKRRRGGPAGGVGAVDLVGAPEAHRHRQVRTRHHMDTARSSFVRRRQ